MLIHNAWPNAASVIRSLSPREQKRETRLAAVAARQDRFGGSRKPGKKNRIRRWFAPGRSAQDAPMATLKRKWEKMKAGKGPGIAPW
jgi:hypothetical protein